jgi:hypothetical protein
VFSDGPPPVPMRTLVAILAILLGLGITSRAFAHGVVGQRFFPATLTIDDPFVADEMSLPTVEGTRLAATDESRSTYQTVISAELSKRLSREFGLSLGGAYFIQDQHDGPAVTGFDNLEVAAKYQFLTAPENEFLLSAGLEADVGGTGQDRVGAESFSTIAPTFFFGKGMGDIPDSMSMLKPFALTGAFALGFPTQEYTTTASVDEHGEIEEERELNPRTIEWGFTVQYSLQYLQSYVRDVGLPVPFNRMIPLVEFAMESAIQGPGKTAGTINPGVIWFGRYIQLGAEALVPVNGNALDEAPQPHVGFIVQLHLYLDDIAPDVFTWTPFSGVLGPTQP